MNSRLRASPRSSGGVGTTVLNVYESHHGGLRLRSRWNVGITDGRNANRASRTGSGPAVAAARTTAATSSLQLVVSGYSHQSIGPICDGEASGPDDADATTSGLAGRASADAIDDPTNPNSTPAKTA